MDKQLLDSVIKLITEDQERINTYDHFDKLLLTFTNKEIDYFLESCDEDIFLNYNLFFILSVTIPKKMTEYIEKYIKNKLQIIDYMENSLKNEFKYDRISKDLYEESMNKYIDVRKKAINFKNLFMNGINKLNI